MGGSIIVYTACKIITGTVSAVARGTGRLGRSLIQRLSHKSITKQNNTARGVNEMFSDFLPASELFKGHEATDRCLLSGETNTPWREALTAYLVKDVYSQGGASVVFLDGDNELKNRIYNGLGGENVLLIEPGITLYDPLRGCSSVEEAVYMIASKGNGEEFRINESARNYLKACLYLYGSVKKRWPTLLQLGKMLYRTPEQFAQMFTELSNQHKISAEQLETVRYYFTNGSGSRSSAKDLIVTLVQNTFRNVVPLEDVREDGLVSIFKAISQKKTIVFDVGGFSTNRNLAYSILVNDIRRTLAAGMMINLVISNVAFESCETLQNLILEGGNHLGIVISTKDLVARCRGKAELFTALNANVEYTVVFKHSSGGSARLWEDFFGQYTKVDRSYTYTSGKSTHPTSLFSSRNTSEGYTETEKMEAKVKAERIQNMVEGEVYSIVKDSNMIINTVLSDEGL